MQQTGNCIIDFSQNWTGHVFLITAFWNAQFCHQIKTKKNFSLSLHWKTDQQQSQLHQQLENLLSRKMILICFQSFLSNLKKILCTLMHHICKDLKRNEIKPNQKIMMNRRQIKFWTVKTHERMDKNPCEKQNKKEYSVISKKHANTPANRTNSYTTETIHAFFLEIVLSTQTMISWVASWIAQSTILFQMGFTNQRFSSTSSICLLEKILFLCKITCKPCQYKFGFFFALCWPILSCVWEVYIMVEFQKKLNKVKESIFTNLVHKHPSFWKSKYHNEKVEFPNKKKKITYSITAWTFWASFLECKTTFIVPWASRAELTKLQKIQKKKNTYLG